MKQRHLTMIYFEESFDRDQDGNLIIPDKDQHGRTFIHERNQLVEGRRSFYAFTEEEDSPVTSFIPEEVNVYTLLFNKEKGYAGSYRDPNAQPNEAGTIFVFENGTRVPISSNMLHLLNGYNQIEIRYINRHR